MPRLTAFHGLVVWMYWNDHPPPHIHVHHGGDWVKLGIPGARLLDGPISPRALRLVREWAQLHRDELDADWSRAQRRLPLKAILPLT